MVGGTVRPQTNRINGLHEMCGEIGGFEAKREFSGAPRTSSALYNDHDPAALASLAAVMA